VSELTVGRRLGERYEVERLLGEGGLARVYQVRHLQLGTRYALKQLSVSRKGLQTRLLREGRIQAQLQHPNVVRVLDVLDVNGQPSLIMEYVEGISLEELIRTEAPLTADLALPLFGQILAGVAAAHNAGVLHRDLKPANVLLSRTSDGWMAKVADFGIAKMAVDDGKGRTRTGIQMGTPGYMAPEQVLDAADVDARADIFALGVVLYEMLVGCRPFGGTSEFQTLDTTVRGQYRPVGEALEHCPDAIRRAVSGSLARHPDDRYASCRELAEVVFADHPELLVPVEEARGRVLTDEELATDRSMPTQHTGGQEVGATLADLDALGSVFTDPEKMVGATLAPSDSAVRSQVAAATEEEPTGRPAWLFGGVLGVGAAVVGAALVLVAGVLVILMFGPGTSTDVAAEEQSESSAAPVATATPADPSAAPAEAGVGSEETEVIDRSSTVSEPVRDVAPEPAAELAAGQPEAAGLATEPQPSTAGADVGSDEAGLAAEIVEPVEAEQPPVAALVPSPEELEEGGGVALIYDPDPTEVAPEVEVASPAVPQVLGSWKGRANGRPLTLHITDQDGVSLGAEASFYLGSTERRVRVSGSIGTDGSVRLEETGGSELTLIGALSGTKMSGTYRQKGQKKDLQWSVSR